MSKSFCYKLLGIIFCLLAGLNSSAFEVDGINYSTKSTGAVVAAGTYSGDIVIPQTVTYDGRTYDVVGIANLAFRNCTGLTSVSIPQTVTSIGQYAFSGCTALQSVNIPSGVTAINARTFYDCNSLTSIDIPAGVTSIGNLAFYHCELLTSIDIPATVETIGETVFEGCNALKTVNVDPANENFHSLHGVLFNADYSQLILYPAAKGGKQYNVPGTVTDIAAKAFYNATALKDLYIPGSVKNVGNEAFRYSVIKSAVFDEGVENIGDYAFANDQFLKTVYLPTTLTGIATGAFSETNALYEVIYPTDSAVTITADVFKSVIRSRSQKPKLYIPQGAEANYTAAGWVTTTFTFAHANPLDLATDYRVDSLIYIPLDSAYNLKIKKVYTMSLHDAGIPVKLVVNGNLCAVTEIALSVFQSCNNITSVEIPGSISVLNQKVFYNCASLREVILNEGITKIDNFAFASCDALSSVHIPASVTTIANKSFNKCATLTHINVDENNTKYASIDGVLFSKDRKKLVTYPHHHGNTYSVPEGTTSIETNAFLATPVTEVIFPSTLQVVNSMAFSEAAQLRTLVIPEGVTKLNTSAFLNCSSLESVDLPSTLTNLGSDVFKGDDNLATVQVRAINPPACTTTGSSAGPFTTLQLATVKLIVPVRRKAFYMADAFWHMFVNIEENLKIGDVNDDGLVNPFDISTLVAYFLDSSVVINVDNADCNQDGRITPTDLSELTNILLAGEN